MSGVWGQITKKRNLSPGLDLGPILPVGYRYHIIIVQDCRSDTAYRSNITTELRETRGERGHIISDFQSTLSLSHARYMMILRLFEDVVIAINFFHLRDYFYNRKQPGTASMTIGIMRKNPSDLSEDMRGWKLCGAGVHKVNGFLQPMGWLLANGTIKRSTTPLKSVA